MAPLSQQKSTMKWGKKNPYYCVGTKCGCNFFTYSVKKESKDHTQCQYKIEKKKLAKWFQYFDSSFWGQKIFLFKNVEPDHIRIRKMTIGSTVSGFDLAMDETNKLGDLKPELSGQGFCLQILKEPETLSQTDRVCSICRWFPEKKRCSTKEEVIGNLKSLIFLFLFFFTTIIII
jgi:hypothetical protein